MPTTPQKASTAAVKPARRATKKAATSDGKPSKEGASLTVSARVDAALRASMTKEAARLGVTPANFMASAILAALERNKVIMTVREPSLVDLGRQVQALADRFEQQAARERAILPVLLKIAHDLGIQLPPVKSAL